jgi:tRNA(Ile)-lysidine synthase TilS/MesJ
MEHIKRVLSFTRRAIDDYRMIEPGDKIAVGVSAGKDSLTLLCAMAQLRRFYPVPFELIAITIDMGFEGADFSPIQRLCDELDVPYHIIPTEISHIIFDIRKEKNPCSLCAKMRRGALHNAAKDLGCNVVALGHHFDDAVETFMMNLFFEGRLGCFSPKSYLSNRKLTLIRPLIYAEESDVAYFARRQELPVAKNPCPEDHATERERMKQLLRTLERQNDGLRHRIFHALCRHEIDGFALHGRYPDAGRLPEDKEE